MGTVLPIKDLLEAGSPKGSAGKLDAVNEAQADALIEEVQKGEAMNFSLLRKVSEGLFRGGEIPDLTSVRDGDGSTPAKKVSVKPVKHLKAAMALTLAALELDGFAGFADGLALMERLLNSQWETVHPVANPDDPDDPYIGRVNILTPLCFEDPAKSSMRSGSVTASDSWGIERRLLKAAFFSSDRLGTLSFRDSLSPFARTMKLTLTAGQDRSAEQVREFKLACAEALPAQRQVLAGAIEAVEGINRQFQAAPGSIKPRFDYLLRLLKAGQTLLEENEIAVDQTGDVAVPVKTPGPSLVTASVASTSGREAALRKLDEVAEYFRRHEPSSPVPIMIDRIKRVAFMNFVALLADLELGEKEFRKWAGLPDRAAEAEAAKKAAPVPG